MRAFWPLAALTSGLLTEASACAGTALSIRHRQSIEAGDGTVESLAFAPDGRTIGACGDWFVQLFDVKTGDRVQQYAGHNDKVRQIAFSSDGNLLASCSNDKAIRLWKVKSGLSRLAALAASLKHVGTAVRKR